MVDEIDRLHDHAPNGESDQDTESVLSATELAALHLQLLEQLKKRLDEYSRHQSEYETFGAFLLANPLVAGRGETVTLRGPLLVRILVGQKFHAGNLGELTITANAVSFKISDPVESDYSGNLTDIRSLEIEKTPIPVPVSEPVLMT